jgi:hypothetical protein
MNEDGAFEDEMMCRLQEWKRVERELRDLDHEKDAMRVLKTRR